MKEIMEQAAFLSELKKPLKAVGEVCDSEQNVSGEGQTGGGLEQIFSELERQAQGRKKLLESLYRANSLSEADRKKYRSVIGFLEERRRELYVGEASNAREAYGFLKEKYTALVARMKQETEKVQGELHALFSFVEEAFDKGNELLILVTELTVNTTSAQFIATFGSPDYQRHNQELMLSERSDDIKAQIAELKLD